MDKSKVIAVPKPVAIVDEYFSALQNLRACPFHCLHGNISLSKDEPYIKPFVQGDEFYKECPAKSPNCFYSINKRHKQTKAYLQHIAHDEYSDRIAAIPHNTTAWQWASKIKNDGAAYMIMGSTGTGKSFSVAKHIYDKWIASGKWYRHLHWYTARQAHKAAKLEWREFSKIYKPGNILVLDDLGLEPVRAEYNTEPNKYVFDEIVDECMGSSTTLIITTNLTPEDYISRYSARARERIKVNGSTLVLGDKENNWRLELAQ